jgi:hypothetical protein
MSAVTSTFSFKLFFALVLLCFVIDFAVAAPQWGWGGYGGGWGGYGGGWGGYGRGWVSF